MCGIVGYLGLDLPPRERVPTLERMCAAIVHRGPDDQGYYSDDTAGLGMRRLSIIDLAGGHQPISCANGTKHIVFNGEIYNYRELRRDLERSGQTFRTNSDTEVVLRQYEQDGEECVHKFNGMFAFAIWDSRRQTLFLARDRLGIKPLYYYRDGARLIFASEIKAILASGSVPRELNMQALSDYLTFRYVPQPETIWRNIYKLPPGHTMTVSAAHPDCRPARYWDIEYSDNAPPARAEELLEEFGALFMDAVRLRLIADVPVGILLSGGLDSSAVAAAISEVHNATLSSFSVSFKDAPGIDERPFARQVAERVGTDHNEVVIGAEEFCDFLPSLVRFADEPLADLASVPLYYVSRLAREKVKVVLSGEGSDEVLGGYEFDLWLHKLEAARARHSRAGLRGLLSSFLKGRTAVSPEQANMTNHRSPEDKRALLRGQAELRDSLDTVRADLARAHCPDPLHQRLFVFCQSWLVEDLLMKADRMSMANSLELRVPFLDHRLVEWAARAPSQIKVGKRADGQYETKRILRRFAEGRLPPDVINRPKMGFPVPLYDWLTGRLTSWAHDLLASSDTQVCRWLEPDAVRRQLEHGTSPDSSLMDRHLLWDLLIFELWSREWQPA